MQLLHLSRRLQALTAFLPQNGGLADIGTDHGYLPVWAAQNLPPQAIFATDIHAGPLSRAKQVAAQYGVADKITFCLCDGLDGLAPNCCKTIILAGMGGDLMAEILSRAPWTKGEGMRLILQPMTKIEVLTHELSANGYAVTDGCVVEDAGRLYQILSVQGGKMALTEADCYFGPWLHPEKEEAARALLEKLLKSWERLLPVLEKSEKPDDRQRYQHLLGVSAELQKRWEACQHGKGM